MIGFGLVLAVIKPARVVLPAKVSTKFQQEQWLYLPGSDQVKLVVTHIGI